jgi:hypothetical protein
VNGMNSPGVQIFTGSLLIFGSGIFSVGGILFTGRAIWKWPVGETPGYLRWERGFVITSVMVAVLGLTLLERMLEAAGDTILAPLGMVTIFTGAVLVIVAETISFSKREWLYAPIVVYVVLAFLGQVAFGVALLQTGLLSGWIGWATVIWNLAWLVILPIARSHNIYYPWLHHAAPLLIGIGLLWRG